jgi:Flp pilus assembly protein TadG
MTKQTPIAAQSTRMRGTLARLRSDASGNVLAMAAAAIFPLAGMMGGALDLSRIYLVKTRLQAACDAGALTGRRVMGSGSWANASYKARTQAESVFLTNFGTGSYGTGTLTKTFTEASGNVSGSASTTIPMTVMQLFGSGTHTVNVTCNSEMRISHSDVMFVLDNTGSMASTIPGDTSGIAKIDGVKLAVKCFYEALAKINITDTTAAQCGASADPSGGNAAGVQLRFGFVPYDQNVNVGRLLNNAWMADNADYQTKVPNQSIVQEYSIGSETAVDWPGTFSNLLPVGSATDYSGWTRVPSDTTINGTTYLRNRTARLTTALCNASNTYNSPTNNIFLSTDVAGADVTTLLSTSNNPPVYPAAAQTLTYSRTQPRTKDVYRYNYYIDGNGVKGCWLEKATKTYDLTRTNGTSTKPISWTPRTVLDSWTYKKASLNVSSLKLGANSWATSITMPFNESSTTVNGTSYKTVANRTFTWAGCIEERKTFQNTSGTPASDWSPIPSSAYDMDIDRVPDPADPETQWKPALDKAVWGRSDGMDASGNWTGSWNTAEVTATAGVTATSRQVDWACPTAARKLTIYDDSTKAANFQSYVNTMYPGGNTYHDIGLLWGARLMSATGIFGAENAFTPSGGAIERHMVFMTDGETYNEPQNYTAYGADWWDRRQTNPSSGPSSADLVAVNNARATALCNAIKSRNINLWVVYYGNDADTATSDRLKACATDAAHFFNASDTPALISNFNSIASAISQLRLTS